MATPDIEIVVDDPDAPKSSSPPVAGTRTVNIVVYLLLLAFAALLAYDNWRTGMGWASDGPEAGYFPFYLSIMLGGASLFGLVSALLSRRGVRRHVRDARPVPPRHAGVRADACCSACSPNGSAFTSRASC